MKSQALFSAAGLLALSVSAPAFADGTITRDEVLTQICSESKPICMTAKGLNLADEGTAIRVGHQFPNSGERIMPYSFTGQLGKDKLPIAVTIDRNDAGKLVITVSDLN